MSGKSFEIIEFYFKIFIYQIFTLQKLRLKFLKRAHIHVCTYVSKYMCSMHLYNFFLIKTYNRNKC